MTTELSRGKPISASIQGNDTLIIVFSNGEIWRKKGIYNSNKKEIQVQWDQIYMEGELTDYLAQIGEE